MQYFCEITSRMAFPASSDILGSPFRQDGPLVDQVGPLGDSQGLPDIVISQEDADPLPGKVMEVLTDL